MNKIVFLLLSFLLMITLQLHSQKKPGKDTIVMVKTPEGKTDTADVVFQLVEDQASF